MTSVYERSEKRRADQARKRDRARRKVEAQFNGHLPLIKTTGAPIICRKCRQPWVTRSESCSQGRTS